MYFFGVNTYTSYHRLTPKRTLSDIQLSSGVIKFTSVHFTFVVIFTFYLMLLRQHTCIYSMQIVKSIFELNSTLKNMNYKSRLSYHVKKKMLFLSCKYDI